MSETETPPEKLPERNGRSAKKESWSAKVAEYAVAWTGSTFAFMLALAVIIVWAVTGPIFNFSDTWQLVINTGTTIVTFLMVFLIQNTQNRDSRAAQLKLDELIKAVKGARNSMIDLERLSDEEMRHLEEEYKKLCEGHVNDKKPQ